MLQRKELNETPIRRTKNDFFSDLKQEAFAPKQPSTSSSEKSQELKEQTTPEKEPKCLMREIAVSLGELEETPKPKITFDQPFCTPSAHSRFHCLFLRFLVFSKLIFQLFSISVVIYALVIFNEADTGSTREKKRKIKREKEPEEPQRIILFGSLNKEIAFPVYFEKDIGIGSKWRAEIHHPVFQCFS